MNYSEEDSKSTQLVKRDLKLSVLTGPLTFIIPSVAYLFLYPIILSRSSLEVLGIWSLYVTTATFFTVADIGFSQHFIREAGSDREEAVIFNLKKEKLSAKRFYLLLCLLGLVFIVILRNSLFIIEEQTYSASGLFYSAVVLIIGTTIQLLSSLDASILSARSDNYFVKLIRSVSPIFTYSVAIVGALLSFPIEGFAAGYLMANIFLLIVYHFRLRSKHSAWHNIKVNLTLKETKEMLNKLFKKGWQLYSVSLGMILRQPVLRYVIFIMMGLPAVGIFDIAIRVTTTLRDVITSGFASLYPSFAYFYRKNDNKKLIEIISISLILLMPVGAVSAMILIIFPEFIYKIWLGDFPAGIISATIILAVWQFITMLNVPFWYLLQASKNEKIAAIAVWAHTISILLLLLLIFIQLSITLDQLLIYWLITALLTQFLIYFFVEKKLSMLWILFRNQSFNIVLFASVGYLAVISIASFVISINSKFQLISALIITALFIISLSPIYFRIIKKSFSFRNYAAND